MKQAKKSFLEWIAARIQERTTAAGIAMLAGAVGLHVNEEVVVQMMPIVGGALILINSTL